MSNYYTDHPEIEFHLNHPLMKRVVDLKERNYAEKDQFEVVRQRVPRDDSRCWYCS